MTRYAVAVLMAAVLAGCSTHPHSPMTRLVAPDPALTPVPGVTFRHGTATDTFVASELATREIQAMCFAQMADPHWDLSVIRKSPGAFTVPAGTHLRVQASPTPNTYALVVLDDGTWGYACQGGFR